MNSNSNTSSICATSRGSVKQAALFASGGMLAQLEGLLHGCKRKG
jgi:hypothetical protein